MPSRLISAFMSTALELLGERLLGEPTVATIEEQVPHEGGDADTDEDDEDVFDETPVGSGSAGHASVAMTDLTRSVDRTTSPAFSVNAIMSSAIWAKPRISTYSLRPSPAASMQLLSQPHDGTGPISASSRPKRHHDSFVDGDESTDPSVSVSDGPSNAAAASDSCAHRFWFQFRLLAYQHAAAIAITLHIVSALSVHVLCGSRYEDYVADGLFSSPSRASAFIVCYSLHALQIATLVGAMHTLVDVLSKGMVKPFALVHVALATIITMAGVFTVGFFHSPASFAYLVNSTETLKVDSAFDFDDSASPSLSIFLVFFYFSTTTFCTIGFGGACVLSSGVLVLR